MYKPKKGEKINSGTRELEVSVYKSNSSGGTRPVNSSFSYEN